MKRLAKILVLLFWLNIFWSNRITHIALALIATLDPKEIEKITKKEFINFPVLFDDEGKFRNKQIINYNKIIGKSYVNDEYIETKLGKVHYSKTGFHVVPYIKKE